MWFIVSDVGWVVGYFYIVYVLFFMGCMMVFYEGKLVGIFDVLVFWCVVLDYGVNVMFIVFIVICVIKKDDLDGVLMCEYDLLSLCMFFFVGECFDFDIYVWVFEWIGVFVVDNWW